MVSIFIRKLIIKKILVIAVALLLVGGALAYRASVGEKKHAPSPSITQPALENQSIGSLYTDSSFFLSAIKQNKVSVPATNVTGIIVPHHLLAVDLVASTFANISSNSYSHIVLLSPDHFDAGQSNLSVTERNVETVFGQVKTDRHLSQKLKELPFITEENFFYREHGLQAILPFIKYYFPEARVTLITFKPTASKQELDTVIHSLEAELPADSLIIQSTDFSHYLTPTEALDWDQLSITAIKSDQPGDILRLKQPENLDSVAALYVQASLQKNFFHSSVTIHAHKNSQDYTSTTVVSSTSYLTAVYGKSQKVDGNAEFIFVGDVMVSRYIGELMEKHNNYSFPYEYLRPLFKKADLVFGNLESPISSRGKSVGSLYSFRADPRSAQGLQAAGFTVMSVANNHAFDYGREAFSDTLDNLKKSNIAYSGGGKNFEEAYTGAQLTVNGIKVTVLAFTDLLSRQWSATNDQAGISYLDKNQMIKSIATAKKISDLVIVSFHWGREYETQSNDRQKEFAQAAVEAGASLIVGHHPHVAQEITQVQNVYVAYSLGNFIFDQNFSKETSTGLLLKVKIKDKKIDSVNSSNVYFNKDFQPYIPDTK